MKKRVLFSILSLVLAVGCETYGELEAEVSDQVLGGDQSGELEENPYWDWADAFPGPVGSTLERVSNVEVTVKGGYSKFAFDESVYPLQSASCYAAPSETVQITLPADAPSNLYCQIGIGHPTYDDQYRLRYNDVVTEYELKPGETTRVLSYFGGFLYFYYNHDEASIPAMDYTVTVSNVIIPTNFIYGETIESEWLADIYPETDEDGEEEEVLAWLELISDRVVLTIGNEEVQWTTDPSPSTLLPYWDTYIEAISEAMGNGDNLENELQQRIYTDLQVPDSLQSASTTSWTFWGYEYPIGLVRNTSYLQRRLLEPTILDPTQTGTTWSYWHAPSFAFVDQHSPSWVLAQDESNIIDVTSSVDNTLYSFALKYSVINYLCATKYGALPSYDLNLAATSELLKSTTDDMWGGLVEEGTVYTYEKNMSHTGRSLFFIQLAMQSDWGLIPYIMERMEEIGFEDSSTTKYDRYDYIAMFASEYLNYNLIPYFHWWRLPITSVACEYMNQFDDLPEATLLTDSVSYGYFFEGAFVEDDILEISETRLRSPKTFDNLPMYTPTITEYDLVELTTGTGFEKRDGTVSTNGIIAYETYYYTGEIEPSTMYQYDDNVPNSSGTEMDALFDKNYYTFSDVMGNRNANSNNGTTAPNTFEDGTTEQYATDYMTLTFLFNAYLDINVITYYCNHARYFSALIDIEYLDRIETTAYGEIDSIWLPTYPDRVMTYYSYYTEGDPYMRQTHLYETYHTNAFRFKVVPTSSSSQGNTANIYRWGQIYELGLGYYGDASDVDPSLMTFTRNYN